MEAAKGMEVEIEMAAEAKNATVPRSVGMRRRRNKAEAQASGLPEGTGWNNSESHGDRIKVWWDCWSQWDPKNVWCSDWNKNLSHGGRNVGLDLKFIFWDISIDLRFWIFSKRLGLLKDQCIVKDATELRLTWKEAQRLLKIFEDHDEKIIKSQILPGSSIVLWGLRTEFEKTIRSISEINKELQDAEEKPSRSETLKLFLEMVKEVAYNADDVLDKLEHTLGVGNVVVSLLTPFILNIKQKLLIIRERLDGVARKKDLFSSREQVGDREEGSSEWTRTSLLVEKPQNHGKDNQKKESLLIISEKECKRMVERVHPQRKQQSGLYS